MKRKQGKSATRYEPAFESHLRDHGVLYIATDERKRPVFGGVKVKNFDFMVISFKGKYIIDVKGRRFADAPWENWIHFSDIEGMKIWAQVLPQFTPLFVFPYLLDSKAEKAFLKEEFSVNDVISFKGEKFGIVGITISDYYLNLKRRGKDKKEGLGGVYVSKTLFRKIAKPISYFIPELREIPKGTI